MSIVSRKPFIWFSLLIYGVLMLILAWVKANQHSLESDFGVFWLAGQRFFGGGDLYGPSEIGREFIYPPFAAFCFQVFAAWPFQWACALMWMINSLLFPGAIYLLYRVLKQLQLPDSRALPALALSALFSAKFFWSNLVMFQVNAIVFVLILLGIYCWLSQRQRQAGVWLVSGTMLKVFPVFFLLQYLLLSFRNWKNWAVVGLAVLLAIGLPTLQRGIEQSGQDWQQYYHRFLEPFQDGRVVSTYKNQNIAASLHRMFRPTEDDWGLSYQWAELSSEWVRGLTYLAYGLLTLVLLGVWLVQWQRGRPPDLYQYAMLFAYTHLMSGISWEAHLVSFMFLLLPFFLLVSRPKQLGKRILYYVLWVWIVLVGMSGSDTLGQTIHHYIGGFNLVAGLMLALFCLYAYGSISKKPNSTVFI